MVALTRVFQEQTDGLKTLRDLADLVNDPKAIIKAHETAREQMALTDEAATKLAEAKDFIARYVQLQKDLKVEQDKLKTGQENLEGNQLKFEQERDAEGERVANIRAELETVKNSHADTDKRHAQERKDLIVYKKKLDDEHSQRLNLIEAREQKVVDDAAANERKASKLTSYEQRLNAKAAKYKEAEAV